MSGLTALCNRWANIVLAAVFTLAIIVTLPGAWGFYIYLGLVEIALTVTIAWSAWKWPKQDDQGVEPLILNA